MQRSVLRGIVETAGVQQHSVDMLDGLIKDKKYSDCLTLFEGFGDSMAYVDHDDLVSRLTMSWGLVVDALNAERKTVKKRIATLKEDKKTDSDVLARQENAFNDICNKRAFAVCAVTRFKIMNAIPLANFKKDANYDGVADYLAIKAEGKK